MRHLMLYREKAWAHPIVTVPPGLKEAMDGLTREVLRHQPNNIYEFCSNYFRKLIELRDGESGRKMQILDKGATQTKIEHPAEIKIKIEKITGYNNDIKEGTSLQKESNENISKNAIDIQQITFVDQFNEIKDTITDFEKVPTTEDNHIQEVPPSSNYYKSEEDQGQSEDTTRYRDSLKIEQGVFEAHISENEKEALEISNVEGSCKDCTHSLNLIDKSNEPLIWSEDTQPGNSFVEKNHQVENNIELSGIAIAQNVDIPTECDKQDILDTIKPTEELADISIPEEENTNESKIKNTTNEKKVDVAIVPIDELLNAIKPTEDLGMVNIHNKENKKESELETTTNEKIVDVSIVPDDGSLNIIKPTEELGELNIPDEENKNVSNLKNTTIKKNMNVAIVPVDEILNGIKPTEELGERYMPIEKNKNKSDMENTTNEKIVDVSIVPGDELLNGIKPTKEFAEVNTPNKENTNECDFKNTTNEKKENVAIVPVDESLDGIKPTEDLEERNTTEELGEGIIPVKEIANESKLKNTSTENDVATVADENIKELDMEHLSKTSSEIKQNNDNSNISLDRSNVYTPYESTIPTDTNLENGLKAQDLNEKIDKLNQIGENENGEQEKCINQNEENMDNSAFQDTSGLPDMEAAAITIQAVFREFLFRSRSSNYDDTVSAINNFSNVNTEHKNNSMEDEKQLEQISMEEEQESYIKSSGVSPRTVVRMNTMLQTVKEEKSASLSTEDSSTFNSAATKIQAQVRRFLTMKKIKAHKAYNSLDTTTPSMDDYLDDGMIPDKLERRSLTITLTDDRRVSSLLDDSIENNNIKYYAQSADRTLEARPRLKREDAIQLLSPYSSGDNSNESTHEVENKPRAGNDTIDNGMSFDKTNDIIEGNNIKRSIDEAIDDDDIDNSHHLDSSEIVKTLINNIIYFSTHPTNAPQSDNISSDDGSNIENTSKLKDDTQNSEKNILKNINQGIEEKPCSNEKNYAKTEIDGENKDLSIIENHLEIITDVTANESDEKKTIKYEDKEIVVGEKEEMEGLCAEVRNLECKLSNGGKELLDDQSNVEYLKTRNHSGNGTETEENKTTNEANFFNFTDKDLASIHQEDCCMLEEQEPENKNKKLFCPPSEDKTGSVDYEKLTIASDVSTTEYEIDVTSDDMEQNTFSPDEMDVVTSKDVQDKKPHCEIHGEIEAPHINADQSEVLESTTGLLHSGEFHDIVLPTKVVRRDISAVRGE